jgi:SAM-dependent methyltransferase
VGVGRWLRGLARGLGGKTRRDDFVRVYPDGLAYDRRGRPRPATANDVRNFRNHGKFYAFAAQFVRGRVAGDLGSGSGHGCRVLEEAGASRVLGADDSEHAVAFARERFGAFAEFSLQSVTDLREWPDGLLDVAVSSEVLEHLKEHGEEERGLAEMRRVTKPGGLLVVGTPNAELLGDHGFSFEEIDALFRRSFRRYVVFENALVAPGAGEAAFERRRARGRVGVVVSEAIDLSETVWPEGAPPPSVKRGIPAGPFPFADRIVDTSLLHNTHSWVILAANDG